MRLVKGVGFNDAGYILRVDGILCPYYDKWQSMLGRCYSKSSLAKRPSYRGCSVSDEWLTFSNFKKWMMKQDWKEKDLDKDLLFSDNKIYSESTCMFIDHEINAFVIEKRTNQGIFPTGVSFRSDARKFQAQIGINGKSTHLGYFDTEQEAHAAWAEKKLYLAKKLADKQTDTRVAIALVTRYEDILTKAKQILISATTETSLL